MRTPAATDRNLHIGVSLRKSAHIHLIVSGTVRGIGERAAVRRERRICLDCRRFQHHRRLAGAQLSTLFLHLNSPKVKVSHWIKLVKCEAPSIGCEGPRYLYGGAPKQRSSSFTSVGSDP